MKISGLDPSGDLGRLLFQIQSKDTAENDQRKTSQIRQGNKNDAVALSSFTQEVRDLSAKVTTFPEIREDRVQQVREALRQNQQLATSQQVASSVISDTVFNSISFS